VLTETDRPVWPVRQDRRGEEKEKD
jgi:hypothetical protein